jgi:hypothetical protein
VRIPRVQPPSSPTREDDGLHSVAPIHSPTCPAGQTAARTGAPVARHPQPRARRSADSNPTCLQRTGVRWYTGPQVETKGRRRAAGATAAMPVRSVPSVHSARRAAQAHTEVSPMHSRAPKGAVRRHRGDAPGDCLARSSAPICVRMPRQAESPHMRRGERADRGGGRSQPIALGQHMAGCAKRSVVCITHHARTTASAPAVSARVCGCRAVSNCLTRLTREDDGLHGVAPCDHARPAAG